MQWISPNMRIGMPVTIQALGSYAANVVSPQVGARKIHCLMMTETFARNVGMKECWKDIPEWEGYYQASNLGRIRSVDRVVRSKGWTRPVQGRVLCQAWNGRYFQVNLSKFGKSISRNVHVLVAKTWLGPKPNNMQVCHGVKGQKDNSVKNIRYGTASENQLDRRNFGDQNNVRPVCRGDGKEFNSIREAALITGSNASRIIEVCKGKRKIHHGHNWSYI